MNWYLVQTKPNAYMLAHKHLQQQAFEVFLPLVIKTSKKASKFVNKSKPLFPGYLFIGTKLEHIPWNSVNATRGVIKAVSFDGYYRPLENNIIESIKCRCDDCDIFQRLDNISDGDLVKIERGPFSDFVCSVDKIAENERVWVLIDILQQQTRAKVALDDLSKIA